MLKKSNQYQAEDSVSLFCLSLIDRVRALPPKSFRTLQLKFLELMCAAEDHDDDNRMRLEHPCKEPPRSLNIEKEVSNRVLQGWPETEV